MNRRAAIRTVSGVLIGSATQMVPGHLLAQDHAPPGGASGGRMGGPPPMPTPYVFESAHAADGSQCILTPEETTGPYPVDLAGNGKMWRSDVRENCPGIPLRLELRLTNVHASCQPLEAARVDLWQCDKDGIYSDVQNLALVPGARHDDTRGQTFLRGIQRADAGGIVRFTTIFPGWYPSRITHIHFQVILPNGRRATSQIAFPEAITREVYNSPLYRQHGQNTVVRSLAEDNVFGDDLAKYQMAKLSGDVLSGFTGKLNVSIAG